MTPATPDRFLSVERLYPPAHYACVRSMHATIIGLGGVGSWTAEALARSGVRALRLIDMDDICVSNINRQIHALDSTIGLSKVDVLAQRIHSIHPECHVETVPLFVTPDNAHDLLDGDTDCVIDATDRMSVKASIIDICRRRNVRTVTVGGAGGRTDPTRLEISDLGTAGSDDLLRATRRKLRRSHGWAHGPGHHYGILAVFSREPVIPPHTCETSGGQHATSRIDCSSGTGSVCHLTATFGLAAAAAALQFDFYSKKLWK